jgi:hypothetical protein
MRLHFLSLGVGILAIGIARAQSSSSDGGAMPQLPVGQTFKQFEFPVYQDGTLKATVNAVEAKGITLNRVETTDLRIQVYDNGAVTTTITSPDADLYLNSQIDEQKMRTKNTVEIDRSDMTATSQACDFDLKNKKYLLRTNVKVVLKHFDFSLTPTTSPDSTSSPTSANKPSTVTLPTTLAAPISPHAVPDDPSVLDTPGAYANTNSAPVPPSSDTK